MNALFRRNGTYFLSDPIAKRPVGESRIINNQYTYGTNSYEVNLKYAVVNYGLDYIRNYQSNRVLYG